MMSNLKSQSMHAPDDEEIKEIQAIDVDMVPEHTMPKNNDAKVANGKKA